MATVHDIIVQRLLAAYRYGHRLVLGFDYDGTLTPIVAHPSLARIYPALRDVLARLAAIPRITVGIISGRSLDDVIGMVGLPELCYAGSTGLELALDGERNLPAAALENRALLHFLIAALEQRRVAYPGMWTEKKPFGFTVHYRQLAAEQVADLRAETLALLEPHTAVLHVLDGPLAIEVAPAIGRDKGTALRAILAHGGPEPATVFYAGDSANDAPALAVATALGGIALGIGPEAPAEATQRLSDTTALSELLAALALAILSRCPTT
jgi:trehalose-phosphatase